VRRPADTASAILKDDPAPALPPQLPPALERVVGRCLEKNRETRFQSARDLAFGLALGGDVVVRSEQRRLSGTWRGPVPVALAILVAALLATVAWLWAAPGSTPSISPLRLTVALGTSAPLGTLALAYGSAVVISPDAWRSHSSRSPSRMTRRGLYVRQLGEPMARELAGTDGANAPFFSKDSRWIAYEGGREILKVAVTGGAPINLTAAEASRGGAWAGDGSVLLAPGNQIGVRLVRVAAGGGTVDSSDDSDRRRRDPRMAEPAPW
jgi:serine/threonine-protein kinase